LGQTPIVCRGGDIYSLGMPYPPADRRRFRPPLPPCPRGCQDARVRVLTRVEFYLYLRCDRCRHMWSIPKPNVAALMQTPPGSKKQAG
jgi:hypothetical protein